MYRKFRNKINKKKLNLAVSRFICAFNKLEQEEAEIIMIRVDYESVLLMSEGKFPQLDYGTDMRGYFNRVNGRYSRNIKKIDIYTWKVYEAFREIYKSIYENDEIIRKYKMDIQFDE